MEKIKNSAGFTLIEMMTTILILVILVVGIGTGIDSATKVYDEATFYSDSDVMASTINTAISDLLRFSTGIHTHSDGVSVVFSNKDWAVADAYLYVPAVPEGTDPDTVQSMIYMKMLKDDSDLALINKGIYPNLEVKDGSFTLSYDGNNGVFTVNYTIISTENPDFTREASCSVRVLNQE